MFKGRGALQSVIILLPLCLQGWTPYQTPLTTRTTWFPATWRTRRPPFGRRRFRGNTNWTRRRKKCTSRKRRSTSRRWWIRKRRRKRRSSNLELSAVVAERLDIWVSSALTFSARITTILDWMSSFQAVASRRKTVQEAEAEVEKPIIAIISIAILNCFHHSHRRHPNGTEHTSTSERRHRRHHHHRS